MKIKIDEIDLKGEDSKILQIIEYCKSYIGLNRDELERKFRSIGNEFFGAYFRTYVSKMYANDESYFIFATYCEDKKEQLKHNNGDIIICLTDLWDTCVSEEVTKFMLYFNHTGVGLEGLSVSLLVKGGLYENKF